MPLTSSTQRKGSLPHYTYLAGSLTDWKPQKQTVWLTGVFPYDCRTACLPYLLLVDPTVFCLRTCWKESTRDSIEEEANNEWPERVDGGWLKSGGE